MDGFVEVYSKATGKKQIVPEHWLNHPVLGKGFAKTPSAKASDTTKTPAGTSSTDNKTPAAGEKKE